MTIARKVLNLISDRKICYECLGRQFSLLSTGMTNTFRAQTLLNNLCMNLHQFLSQQPGKTTMSYAGQEIEIFPTLTTIARNTHYLPAIKILQKHHKPVPEDHFHCEVCHDLFSPSSIESICTQLVQRVKFCEFHSFLIGSRFPGKIIEKEEEFRAKFDLWHGEALKSNFNRVLGIEFSALYDVPVDFSTPDLLFIISFDAKFRPSIEMQIHPLFIQGRYNKFKRGIPQTKWPCRVCHGLKINAATRDPCSYCNGAGKLYPTSVEEEISELLLELSQGSESKFHGAGREDIDALCLGTGRPFVVEIKDARVRHFDLALAEKEINEQKTMVAAHNLAFSSKNYVQTIKKKSQFAQKQYQALTQFSQPISEEIFETKLYLAKNALVNQIIEQQTPTRVAHRRADHVRKKKVFNFDGKYVNSERAMFYFTTQGGTYIKELIHGDKGRTQPNLSDIFEVPMECLELDILSVQDD